MLLHSHPFEFVLTDIYDNQTREQFRLHNPSMKIPMVVDDDQVVFDSGVIYRYLQQKLDLPMLTWQQENLLTTVNAVNDSLVHILMLQRSQVEIVDDALFMKLQRERLDIGFAALDNAAKEGAFDGWHYLSISLFCLLDWAEFRQLYDFSSLTHLHAFWTQHRTNDAAVETDPR